MGECYKDAFLYAFDKCKKANVVHGIVKGQGKLENIRYGHAWVEYTSEKFGDTVYDPLTKKEYPIGIYYNIGEIKYAKVYTINEAMNLSLMHETYGPWDKKISARVHNGD